MSLQRTISGTDATGTVYILSTDAMLHQVDLWGTGQVTVSYLPFNDAFEKTTQADLAGVSAGLWRPILGSPVDLAVDNPGKRFNAFCFAVKLVGTGTFSYTYTDGEQR